MCHLLSQSSSTLTSPLYFREIFYDGSREISFPKLHNLHCQVFFIVDAMFWRKASVLCNFMTLSFPMTLTHSQSMLTFMRLVIQVSKTTFHVLSFQKHILIDEMFCLLLLIVSYKWQSEPRIGGYIKNDISEKRNTLRQEIISLMICH